MSVVERSTLVPLMRTFLVCDNCGAEVMGGEPSEWCRGRWLIVLPEGWLCTYEKVDYDGKNGRHFCSEACLRARLARLEEPLFPAPPLETGTGVGKP